MAPIIVNNSHLCEGLGGPRAEPIDHASVEQGGGGGAAPFETVASRIHREHHVKAALNLYVGGGGYSLSCMTVVV